MVSRRNNRSRWPGWRRRSSGRRRTWGWRRSLRGSSWRSRTARTERPAHYPDWTIDGLAVAIRERKVSAVEVTTDCLERIGRLDGRLRAFITVDAEGALASARALDADAEGGALARGASRRAAGLQGPLPYPRPADLVRDQDGRYFIAEHDATAVSRLRAAGAITLGKLNMTKPALGPFGDNAHHGHADNPGAPATSPAARRADRASPSPPGSRSARSARIRAARSGCPPACCGIAGLSPPTGG